MKVNVAIEYSAIAAMLAALRIVLIKIFDCAVSHLDRDRMRADHLHRTVLMGFSPSACLSFDTLPA